MTPIRGGIDEIVDDFAAIQFPDHEARLLALAYRDQQADNERLREALADLHESLGEMAAFAKRAGEQQP